MKISKMIINREDLFSQIFREGLGPREVQANVCALIRDLEKSVNLLKNMNKVIDFESNWSEKQSFKSIMDDFYHKTADMLACEQVAMLMID